MLEPEIKFLLLICTTKKNLGRPEWLLGFFRFGPSETCLIFDHLDLDSGEALFLDEGSNRFICEELWFFGDVVNESQLILQLLRLERVVRCQ